MARPAGTFQTQPIGIPSLHRGAAFADLDQDGRVDIVVTRLGEPPFILHNTSGSANHWLRFRLTGKKSNRDAIGTRIHLVTAAGDQWNHVTTSVGYASSSEKEVHFGLGAKAQPKYAEIRWPSGAQSRVDVLQVDRVIVVSE